MHPHRRTHQNLVVGCGVVGRTAAPVAGVGTGLTGKNIAASQSAPLADIAAAGTSRNADTGVSEK